MTGTGSFVVVNQRFARQSKGSKLFLVFGKTNQWGRPILVVSLDPARRTTLANMLLSKSSYVATRRVSSRTCCFSSLGQHTTSNLVKDETTLDTIRVIAVANAHK